MENTVLNKIAIVIGKGIISGAVGIAGMLLSQEIEKKVFGRTPNRAPAEVADKILGLKPANRASEAKFNRVIESTYGSVWGIFRALLGSQGIKGPGASALHLAAIGANIAFVVPALGLVPSPQKWGKKKLALEMIHHTVYAFVAGWTYDAMDD